MLVSPFRTTDGSPPSRPPAFLWGLDGSRFFIRNAAFDSRTRSARELLRQVQSKRFVEANPRLKIAAEMHSRPDPPTATFQYVDGTEVGIF